MTFDNDKLVNAALEASSSPLAIEYGSELAEFWIERQTLHDVEIVAVETGFVLWLEPKTVIVGVQDLLTRELFPVAELPLEERLKLGRDTGVYEQVIGNEWKTTKEQTKWWNEDSWMESITTGSQIAIYGLALMGATYYPKVGEPITPNVKEPKLRVKAISKSTPPVIWPRRDGDGIVTLSPQRLQATKEALIAKAASIRAMRASVGMNGIWQVPGIWCENKFRKTCTFYDDCLRQRPCEPELGFDLDDPAAQLAVPHIDRIDNDLVILSASSYGTVCECPEKYRRGLVRKSEESLQLDTGSVFHAIVAESYRQLKERQ